MILSESYLRNEQKEHINTYKYETLLENRKYNSMGKYDLFISHSYMDRELVKVLYEKFEEAGYKLYIDWKEKTLQNRENVSAETASQLKIRMNNCMGLSYIATSNIVNSKWCPWELGYADGKKNKAAILPITKDKVYEYKGLEYLGIYPYIDYEKRKNGNYEFWVNDAQIKNKYTSLREWLDGNNLKEH